MVWVLLTVVLTTTASGWGIWQARQDAERSAERMVVALARVAQERVDGSLRSIDMLLADVAEKAAGTPPAEPPAAYIKARIAGFPEVRGVALIDPDGRAYYYSFQEISPIDLSDREHFQVHRGDPSWTGTYLSQPLIDRASKKLSVFATRSILDANGRFLGVVSAVVLSEYFSATLSAVTPDDGGAAYIINRQCEVLSRIPAVEGIPVGWRLPDDSPLCQVAHEGGGGVLPSSWGEVNSVPRIAAYRSLADRAGIVAVGVSQVSALRHWRQEAVTTILVELVVILFVLVMLVSLLREERRREDLMAELRLTVERLARTNQDLENFAYAASHDLQEPVRGIVSYAQLLSRHYGGRLDQEADTFLTYIVEAGWKMHNLIKGVLAYSRAGTSERPFERIDGAGLLRGVQATLSGDIREAGAILDLPADPPQLWGDRIQMELAFTHLLANAIKFRKPGVVPQIRLSVRPLPGAWEFTLADNGVGVPPEYAETIFVIFRRLHPQQQYPGSGVGLALVKRIIERHGGTIRLDTGTEEGARFVFTLPAVPNEP